MSSAIRAFAPCLAACLFVSAGALRAQEPQYNPRTDRLRGLTASDLARIEPYLPAGPVALVEFADTDGDELPGINVAAEIQASAADIVSLLRQPEHYPRFMRTLDAVELVQRRGDSVVYDWKWGMALFELSGRNSMRFFSPPKERPGRGYRITVDSQSGDLGQGRMSIRVRPRGPHKSVVVLSLRLDLRRANYIARTIAKASRSINRSANMSLAYAMLLSLQREAERRAGHERPAHPPAPLARPEVDARKVLPLLNRGDLVLLDMSGGGLPQIGILGLIHHEPSRVRRVMLDADAFGSAMMPGSEATVVSRQGSVTVFDWDIDLPLVGVSGQMKLHDDDPRVAIEATRGALEGGSWHFETKALARQVTMITGWARFDLGKSSWLLKRLAGADPYLGHGLSAASEVMLVRAIRSRARKLEDGADKR